ncbi:MAG: glycosyltransferase family 2 protein [Bacteroidales bacterium]|jgi:dolichol-phosphate mannosyltransferase
MTYIIDVSIIIPVYYNELSIESTFNLIKTEVITKYSEKKFEIIMIDDGSKDNSFYVMQKIFDLNPDLVRLVKFTRNFGQVPAIYCGYQIARGKYITTISADLQDPPSLICDMINILETTDFDIVCCNRIDREEGFVRKLTSRLFYYLIKKLSFKNMPLGGFDFVSISSRVRDVLLRNKESNPFWQGQILWTGFKIHFIPYVRQKREHGKSKWTFSKKLKYLIDGVLSYSYFPIRFISFCGLLTFLIGIIYSIIIIIQYLLGNYPFQGWTPIMILILLIGGLQLFMLGIIGEYLWRTLDQTRQRELFIIDVIVEKNSK